MKTLLVVMGAVGVLVLLNAFLPQVWRWGFTVEGLHIPWGIPLLGGFIFFAYRAK